MKQRRVLITGAAGFVGRTLALGLADLGWRVIGLDRVFAAEREDHGIRWVPADLTQGVSPDVPEVDLVVHAAWVTTDAATLGITPADHVALNLRPLLTILEYAARTSPDAFVFLSSSGVFAPDDATEGLSDTHHPTGGSPYAAAKRAGEVLVPTALDQGIAVHVVRLGYLFGPGEVARPSRSRVSLVAGWLGAARDGQPLAVRSDDPPRDWTFTSDLAPALARVVDGPSAGRPVHLGSPHVCRDRALATLIASQVPGTKTVTVPATGRVKPPMVPSDIPSLRGFGWTDPHAGLRALLAEEVAT
jgi:nucleoside-diphosphate-sugar epimerase